MKQKLLLLVTAVTMAWAATFTANATATLTIKGTEVDLASIPKSGTTKVGNIIVGKDMTGKNILIELFSDVNDGLNVINVPDGKTLISYTGDEYDWIGVMIDSDLTINCKNSKMFYFQGSSSKYAQVEFMPHTSPGKACTLTCNHSVTEAGYTRPLFDLAYTRLTLNTYTKRKLNLELNNTADKALIFNAFHSSYLQFGYGDVHMVANDGATKYRFFGETNTNDMHVVGLGRFDSYDENNYLSTPRGAQIYDDIVLKDCEGNEIRGEVTLKYLPSQYAYFDPDEYSDWRLVQDCSGEVTLQIKGAGDLSALDPATLPWKPYADLITKVEVSSDLMIPLTKLPKGAFADLKVLKNASLYNATDLEEVSEACFAGCEKLEEITFNEYAGALLSVGARAFMACEKLKELAVPESVENIGDSAFLNCPLAEITLPVSLKTLGVRPFNTTKTLILPKDIGEQIVNNNILPGHSAGAVSFTGADISLKYEGTMEEWLAKDRSWIMRFWSGTKAHLFIDGKEVVDLVIPEGVTEIKDNTFRDCKEIETVKFPSTLTKIGAFAFRNNKKLTKVELPKAVSEIGEWCFDGCEALEDLDLSEALTAIPEGAFSECSSLTMVDIPDAVTSIAAGAFEECENLEIVSFGEGIQKIDATAFILCQKFELVGFMASIGEVEIDRTELEKELNDPDFLELKETEPEKYEMMYAYYSNLNPFMHVKTVALFGELTDWIKYDREWVMGHIQPASKLVRNNITNEVKEVSFAEGIKFISNYAFTNIASITSLTLPVSMESIGDSTFAGCTNLAAVETKATVPPTLGKDAFAGIKEGAELTMPEEAIKEYVASDWAKYFDIFGGYTVTAASANAALGEVTLTFDDKDIISKGEEANSYVVGNKAKGHLVATPKDKYTEFVTWNDEAEGFDQSERDVTITGDFDYVAKFQKDSFNVVVEVEGIDPKLVEISGAGKYGRGDNVTLTFKMEDEHYDFDMWLFDKNNFEDEATLVFEDIDADHDVQIRFNAKYYPVKATVTPEGAGVVKGQGDYEYNTLYTLTLEPAEGYELKEWRDGVALDEKSNVLSGMVFGEVNIDVVLQLKHYTINTAVNDEKMGSVTGAGEYEHGATVTLTATANAGYRFVKWNSGATDNPLVFTANDNSIITAIFEAAPEYTITVIASPADGGQVLGGGKYQEGAEAQLIAVANSGFNFVEWNDGVKDAIRKVVVTEDAIYTAKFEKQEVKPNEYDITVVASPAEGGTVTGAGTYEDGKIATLTATAAEGYTFKQWSDGNTDNPRSVVVTENKTYTAEFEKIPEVKQFTITVFSPDETMGTVEGGGTFDEGSVIEIKATAKEGYEFVKWNDGVTDNPRSVTVTKDETFIANFQQKEIPVPQFTITVLSPDETKGTVEGGGTFDEGSVIEIKAIAKEGYEFVKWNDGNTDNPRSVKVEKDMTLIANFQQKAAPVQQFTVTVLSANETMGSVTGGGTFDEGSEIEIKAIAAEGYEFVRWSDGNTDNPRSVKVEKDMTLIANFQQKAAPVQQFTVTVLSADETMGSVTGGGTFDEGSIIEIKAVAKEGFEFVKWNDGVTDNPRSVKVEKDQTFIANFQKIEEPDYTPKNLKVEVTALENKDMQVQFSWDAVETGGMIYTQVFYELRVIYEGEELISVKLANNSISVLLSEIAAKTDKLVSGTYQLDWQVRSIDTEEQPLSEWAQGERFEVTIEIPEGIENVETSLHGVSVRKVLINGHVYILTPDGRIFDAQGKLTR